MIVRHWLSDPKKNQLLNGLPSDVWERLSPHLELVHLKFGDVIHESGGETDYAYFPTTAIASLLLTMEDSVPTEVAIVGNDGMLGVALFMGGETMPYQAVIQSEGYAFRFKAEVLKSEFKRFGVLLELLLCYAQALLTQMSQLAVCNRHHSIDQQVGRWMLMRLDRLSTNELRMTQEFIANMLGVRRESVAEAAAKLQRRGLIHYRRGHIRLMDRPGLENASCECYQVLRQESQRLSECREAS